MSPVNIGGVGLKNARIVGFWTSQRYPQIPIRIVEACFGETNFVSGYPSNIAVISGRLPTERVVWKATADLRAQISDRAGRRRVRTVNALQSFACVNCTSG